MRRLLATFVLLAPLVRAQDADLAALFPADTFLYVEADAAALEKGVRELDVARLLANPKYRDFFRPTFDRLGLDPERPLDSLLELLPVRDFLKGRLAIGVRGVALRFRGADGAETVLEVTPGKPVDATLVHRVLGLLARAEITGRSPDLSADLDVLAVVEPGPRAREARLAAAVTTTVRIGDEHVTMVDLTKVLGPEAPPLHADLGADRWILATGPETLFAAQRGGPEASLARSGRFQAVRRRMSGDGRVLFGYADLAAALRMLEGFVPPIVAEAARMNGLASVRGLGFGVSLAEGGVRESLGLVLDGDPKGFWRVLDGFPGGLRSIEVAPPDAIAVVAAKADPALLLKRLEETAAILLPGTEDLLRPALQRELARVGIDLEKEILGALGDEVAVIAFPLEAGAPSVVFGLEVRDEEAFRGLLAKLRARIPAGAPVSIMDVTFEGGPGWQVFVPMPTRPPIFVIRKGHLFGATEPARLSQVLNAWGDAGAQSLARDGEIFGRTLRGLTGGGGEDLIALAYVDLRAVTGIAASFGAFRQPEWLDAAHLPDTQELALHLHGAAVGLRRSGEGLNLDLFSPVGVLLPAVAQAIRESLAYDPARELEELRLAAASQDPDAPYWGIQSLVTEGEGVQILGVFDGGPAEKAGLQAGDLVYRIGEAEVRDLVDLRRETLKHKPGDRIRVAVRRGVEDLLLELVLARRGDHMPG